MDQGNLRANRHLLQQGAPVFLFLIHELRNVLQNFVHILQAYGEICQHATGPVGEPGEQLLETLGRDFDSSCFGQSLRRGRAGRFVQEGEFSERLAGLDRGDVDACTLR